MQDRRKNRAWGGRMEEDRKENYSLLNLAYPAPPGLGGDPAYPVTSLLGRAT